MVNKAFMPTYTWASHPSANQAKLVRAIANVKAGSATGEFNEEDVKAEYIKLGGNVVEKETVVKPKRPRSRVKKVVDAIIGKE